MTENIYRQIDIQEIASKLGTSYSWFRKAFKEYTGYAPAQYFQEIKLRKLKNCLQRPTFQLKKLHLN